MLREFTEAHPEESVVPDFREGAEDDSGNALTSATKKRKRRRTNEFISKHQAINPIAGFEFADAIGLPLNISVDISRVFFSGTADDRTRFAGCQQRLSKWALRRGFPLTMIWTREVGKNGGTHTHILLHIPPELIQTTDFQQALERLLEPEDGPIHDKAILIQRAYFPLGKLLYALKGIDQRYATQFGIRPAYQGALSGKRAGCTQNLGPGARRKATTREVGQPSSLACKKAASTWTRRAIIGPILQRPSLAHATGRRHQTVAAMLGLQRMTITAPMPAMS
jgi:hypothetical protein